MRYARNLLWAFLVSGCMFTDDYTPMRFDASGQSLIATGAIDGSTLAAFEAARAQNPQANTLVLRFVEGSVDDDANLKLARVLRASGMKTVLPADGLIASGGTDLFLAGAKRVIEDGACVGVHAWGTDQLEATDLPKTDPVHALYLRYYADIGIDPAFYWFTLEAAAADDMHWMSPDEVARFDMSDRALSALGTAPACFARLERGLAP